MHCDRKEKAEDNSEQRNFFFFFSFKPLTLVISFREERVFINVTGKKSFLPKSDFWSKLLISEMN